MKRSRTFRKAPGRSTMKMAHVARKRKLEEMKINDFRKEVHGEGRQFETIQAWRKAGKGGRGKGWQGTHRTLQGQI